MALSVQRLFLYPVKSLRPVEVKAVELTNEGLRFDRSFILVYTPTETATPDPTTGPPFAQFLTIKRVFRLALFQPEIDDSWTNLTIRWTGPPSSASSIVVPLTPSPMSLLGAQTYQVSVFGTTALGVDVGDEVAAFFSGHLQADVRLLFIGGTGRREIPGAAYVGKGTDALTLALEEGLRPQRIRFADAAPLLVTSTASEHNARMRLPPAHRNEDIIQRLRPNIHIDVQDLLPAYDEDRWATLMVSADGGAHPVTIKCIFNCVRCLSLNADPDTGNMIPRQRQLYGLLASDRRVNPRFPHKPVFGQYAFAGPAGAILRIGDKVQVTERSSPVK
ncbi:uncharacterized protein HMPREF1541_10464 [Cyphellophora europaea CBS 101466]|uniref:MOSC domain-containing protein n=1 Tax=Cyphellophora europaea (strain CBS 101466) TaxID=1220924 RepID=W2S8M6_CYPE1|nr:uncharacterized protein HMPREF1541_10464 [Cyphellophora europaea CBS 101466]ETN44284.1 hypothetical protein HMPREF1541_10464 [Cyphellophora europaea CBS 101466]